MLAKLMRKYGQLLITATICTLVVAAIVFVVNWPTNGITVGRLEADLNEQLPDGSTRESAEKWFARHGIQPWDITDLEGRKTGLGAIVPNNTLLNTAEIRIFLYFSPEGGLNYRKIYRFSYSL